MTSTRRSAPPRVVIVDDSDQIRRLLKRALRDVCEIVGELSDGNAAAAEVEETQPEIVIMDMQMPLVDGAESTRRIKTSFRM